VIAVGEPDDADRLVAVPGEPGRNVILAGEIAGQQAGEDPLIDGVSLGTDRDRRSQLGLAPTRETANRTLSAAGRV
jgi:hypothetical protein